MGGRVHDSNYLLSKCSKDTRRRMDVCAARTELPNRHPVRLHSYQVPRRAVHRYTEDGINTYPLTYFRSRVVWMTWQAAATGSSFTWLLWCCCIGGSKRDRPHHFQLISVGSGVFIPITLHLAETYHTMPCHAAYYTQRTAARLGVGWMVGKVGR